MLPISRIAVAPDGRLFVCEIHGSLRIFKNDVLLPTPFLTVDAEDTGEHGLDGVCFDPDFATNHYIYIYYTAKTPTTHNRVSRFTADGDVAVPGSEFVLLDLDDLSSIRHVAGGLGFGNDGKLYISVGNDSNVDLPQDLSNLEGKILRINPDGTIPTDNPYYSATTGKNHAIWAIGLRNPFSFDFQRSTGRLFINDVGNESFEEINDGLAGGNYGHPIYEGYSTDPSYISPLFAYPHGDGNDAGCAITGGAFYQPAVGQFPSAYLGKYFFHDFCNKWIKILDPLTNAVTTFATDLDWQNNCSLTVAPDGSLYYAETWDTGGNGAVFKVTSTSSFTPLVETQSVDQLVSVGDSATFTITAYGNGVLSYQWQKNGVDIAAANAPSYTTPAATLVDNNSTYLCVVSDSMGETATSMSAKLTVTTDTPPVPIITLPVTGSHYKAGDVIQFAGTATDAEDQNIGQTPSAFTWDVVFHHLEYTQPLLDNIPGVTSGSFTIPRNGEPSTQVWYRVGLTVTDSGGLSSQTFVDVLPSLSQVKLATSPPGLQLTFDGAPTTTPASFDSVVNFIRTIGAPASQIFNGISYEFVAWTDAGALEHDISTPEAPGTFTATYRAGPSGTISASPNPIVATDGAGTGSTTISWTSTGTPTVEVHLDSPDGPLFAQSGSGNSSQTTDNWVTDGRTFYLQDVSGGLSLTSANTLAQVSVSVSNTITANPNPIYVTDGTGQGITTLSWNSASASVEVHVNAPDGVLLARSGSGRSSQTTDKWVSDGTTFYLQDVSGNLPLTQANTLATVSVAVIPSAPPPTPTPTPSPTPPLPPASQPLNLSARLPVGTGDNVLISGFIVTGNAPKKIIVRAIGSSLAINGLPVAGRLIDPTLELLSSSSVLATNDNWKVDDLTHQSQQAEIEATTLAPSNDLESAIVKTLSPGPYTAVLRGKSDGTGIALVEVYDLDQAADSQTANLSTRGFVQAGDNVMIGGFILGGDPSGTTLLIRGLGPSLTASGVANVLADPALELHNADGTIVVSNDNWKVNDQTQESQEADVIATTLPPADDHEAATIARLAPGAYTVILRDKADGVGVGLLEIYHLQ
jgi:glucose/arabinose dehydrogenase